VINQLVAPGTTQVPVVLQSLLLLFGQFFKVPELVFLSALIDQILKPLNDLVHVHEVLLLLDQLNVIDEFPLVGGNLPRIEEVVQDHIVKFKPLRLEHSQTEHIHKKVRQVILLGLFSNNHYLVASKLGLMGAQRRGHLLAFLLACEKLL
jgi:hypothetical protein